MSRYQLLIQSIAESDLYMVRMFLYAGATIAGYGTLGWLSKNETVVRAARWMYLIFILSAFIFLTVYSG